MDQQELKDRKKIILAGIIDFLEDHDLDLSNQNIERVETHIFNAFANERSISATAINNFLSRIFEYNEFNWNSMNSNSNAEQSEALLVNILISSDIKKRNSKRTWPLILLVCAIVISAYTTFYPTIQSTNISANQAEELQSLASEIVKTEKQNDNATSYQAIWNTIKKLDSVTQYGFQPSYKDFTITQYEQAKLYLKEWLDKAKNSAKIPNKGHEIQFIASEIEVIDGDTFAAKNQRYRLWGIDAFELKQECFDKQKNTIPCGTEAKTAFQDIVNHAKNIKCQITTKDRYERLVVKCSVDAIELGSLLVQSGWALNYEKYSGDTFKKNEEEARSTQTGAWSGCFVKPWDYRHRENLNICK